MDLVKISLEALLQRATNAQNENVDTAAVEAFCALVNKEQEGPAIGVKLLSSQMHAKQEQVVLQTLHILDCGMRKCGFAFQDEVGKFRFLNEMIKLVSPKYLGSHTPPAVKQKVLQLMYLWMLDYPKQTKIKDAYDMLKKQGVIKEEPLSVQADFGLERAADTIFHDEEKSKLLRKLLQSKNPDDLQAANRLIKTMVKEDEKKAELKSRRISELESVQNNIRLLNEMLDSYRRGVSSQDELDLIRELHASCLRMRSNVAKFAAETQQNDEILGEILRINDELGQVFDKYQRVVLLGQEISQSPVSLLDLSSNDVARAQVVDDQKVEKPLGSDILCDIDILTTPLSDPLMLENDESLDILKPCNSEILKPKCLTTNGDDCSDSKSAKSKAFDDLDALGESLLKENLQKVEASFNNKSEKIPMNQLMKQRNHDISIETDLQLDSNLLEESPDEFSDDLINGDDFLVDITESPNSAKSASKSAPKCDKPIVKLGDIFVDLQSIKPNSSIAPITALDDKNGIILTFHFAKDKPHEDVSVIVVTIVSKNQLPVRNVLFRAIVPEGCRVKLQSASATEFPPFNPFLPPAAITQVMLISNPERVQLWLKFIISYNIEDETTTEMGEISSLPT